MTAAHKTFPLNTKGYPTHWPERNPMRPDTVASKITDQQKKDLYDRKISTRDLAKQFNVREAYLSHLFSGKVPGIHRSKKLLTTTRKEYRNMYAAQVLTGKLSIKEAAKASITTYRSMARIVQMLKKKVKDEQNTTV